MAEGILTNISEMIDLAIGVPEVGVVDFCMLQTVLHCLAQQLGVKEKNVELRGNVASFPVGRQTDDNLTIAVDEYLLETDGKPAAHPDEQETMLIVQRIRKGDENSTRVDDGRAKPASPRGRPHKGVGGTSKSADSSSGRAEVDVPNETSAPSTGPGVISDVPSIGPPSGSSGKAPSGATGGAPAQSEAPAVASGGDTDGAPTGASEAAVEGASNDVTPSEPSHEENKTVAPTEVKRPSAGTLGPRMISSSEKLSLVTISKFNLLESTVEDLKNRVYGSIPKNEEILQEVRSQTNLKAITDMWTSLNVSSRLEAAEEGIAKLSSLVQDLIAESPGPVTTQEPVSYAKEIEPVSVPEVQPHTSPVVTPSEPVQQPAELVPKDSPKVHPPKKKTPPGSPILPPSFDIDTLATKEELAILMNLLNNLSSDHSKLTDTFYAALHELNVKAERPPPSLPPASVVALPPVASPVGLGDDLATHQKIAVMDNKLQDLENKLNHCYDAVFAPGGSLQDQISSLQDQIESNLRFAAEASDGTKLSPELAKDLEGLMQLFQTVQDMQAQLQQVHETAVQLASEKEDRQQNINSLLEQIELLKTIKLDREDMVEALADKADLRMLARKVSHDQFEMACDDLSRGLEHALGKLNFQESLWQQALDDIQREIETKLDKMELSPVKEFFNNKLKQLQENLKQMAALRREVEAAGTKKRLLTNVNCISCDAKAVMSMDPPAPSTTSKGLPPSMSMKPYLSYELDIIRKTQASGIPQRNMHDWERIDKQASAPKPPQKVRSETDKHLCNRYCGGSHTTTTPAQRVTRLGHFIKQWGPEVLPLSSGFATGDDGRLYKVSTSEAANVGPGGAVDAPCTPKSAKKNESKPGSQKPPFLPPECRCLDEQLSKK